MSTRATLPLLMLLSCFAAQADAAKIAPYRFPVKCGKPNAFVPYAASQRFEKPNTKITRIIVGIHSSGFDSMKCLDALQQAAARVKGTNDLCLIVTPQFFDVNHIKEQIPEGLIAWKVSPYRGTSGAVCGPKKEGVTFSAYGAMNQLLTHLVDLKRFPNLTTVVVVGHSSGGQMAQRYAVAGTYVPQNGVAIRYVASAPSSFAYLDAKRPRQGSPIRFEALDGETLKRFPHYNKWGYGLENRYQAFRRGDDDFFRRRYAARRVLYLCGSKDTDTQSSSLSTNYGAMLQGRQRLERMRFFYAHLIDVFGEDIRKTHAMAVAPGVDHNGFKAYVSRPALRFLFDFDPRDSDRDGASDWDEWLAGT